MSIDKQFRSYPVANASYYAVKVGGCYIVEEEAEDSALNLL